MRGRLIDHGCPIEVPNAVRIDRAMGPWQVASGLGQFHIGRMQVAHALTLTVNGGAVEAPDGTSVAGLLHRLGLDRRKVAVERNEEIVVRSTYDTTVLQAGDRIEIVHFIGGG